MEVCHGGPNLSFGRNLGVGIVVVGGHDVQGVVAEGPHVYGAAMGDVVGVESVVRGIFSMALGGLAAILRAEQGADGEAAMGRSGLHCNLGHRQFRHCSLPQAAAYSRPGK